MAEMDNTYMEVMTKAHTQNKEKGMTKCQDSDVDAVPPGKQAVIVQQKQHHVSLGIAVGCVILVCIVVAVFGMMTIQSHKSFIEHLTRIEENVLKLVANFQIKVPESTKITLFTRWGHTDCPNTAELIYKGRTAGTPYGSTGSGANFLCLTDKPQYRFTVGLSQVERGAVYGTEYRYGDFKFTPLKDNHLYDVPCAICQAPRSVTLMIPAVTECPNGWTKEYDGYLMTSRGNRKRTEFICVDENQSVVPDSNGARPQFPDDEASTLFLVEGKCNQSGGGLNCSVYGDSLELSCVVCTL